MWYCCESATHGMEGVLHETRPGHRGTGMRGPAAVQILKHWAAISFNGFVQCTGCASVVQQHLKLLEPRGLPQCSVVM